VEVFGQNQLSYGKISVAIPIYGKISGNMRIRSADIIIYGKINAGIKICGKINGPFPTYGKISGCTNSENGFLKLIFSAKPTNCVNILKLVHPSVTPPNPLP